MSDFFFRFEDAPGSENWIVGAFPAHMTQQLAMREYLVALSKRQPECEFQLLRRTAKRATIEWTTIAVADETP